MLSLGRSWRSGVFAISFVAIVATIAYAQQIVQQAASLQVQTNPPGSVGTSQSPWVQTASAAAGATTVTQPAVPGRTNYCTGFEVTGSGATAASVLTITLASGATTLANYSLVVPAGVTTTVTPLIVEFPIPVSGLSPGQSMVLTVASFGAGNTNATTTMHGFTQ